MYASQGLENNRLGLLAAATAALQLTVIAAGVLLKLSLPQHQVDLPPAAAAPEAVLPKDAQPPEEIPAVLDLPEASPRMSEVNPAPRIIAYRVKPGDTLSRIWALHGAPAGGAVLAADAFKEVHVPLSALKVEEEIELQISPAGDITALRKKLSEGRELLLDGDSVKGYKASIIKPDVVQKERVVTGAITHSFSEAALNADLPAGVADDLVDLFSGRVEFSRELQAGDMFAVVYDEHRTADGQFIKAGPIKAASLEKGGRMLFALRHEGKSGKAAYYDQYGKPLGDSFLRYPLQFSRITSAFSYGRFHPILKRVLPHNGIDFAAPLGTPVRSVADGIVTFAGYSFGGGNTVKIKHGDRYATAYLHLSRIVSGVYPGARLARGQLLGSVGSTGLSTGPHLHYSFYDRGHYVNPLKTQLPCSDFGVEPIPPAILQAKVEQLIQSQDTVRVAIKRDEHRYTEASM